MTVLMRRVLWLSLFFAGGTALLGLMAMNWICEPSAFLPLNWWSPTLCGDGKISSAADAFREFVIFPAGFLTLGLIVPLSLLWDRFSLRNALVGASATLGILVAATTLYWAATGAVSGLPQRVFSSLLEIAPLLLALYTAALTLAFLRALQVRGLR